MPELHAANLSTWRAPQHETAENSHEWKILLQNVPKFIDTHGVSPCLLELGHCSLRFSFGLMAEQQSPGAATSRLTHTAAK